jgi:hypothetical protein
LPTVIFKSRTVMIELTYYAASNTFSVAFSRATCAWGDFMSAIHRSLLTVLTALKASGYDVAAPLDLEDGVARCQYDPRSRVTYVSLAQLTDDWQAYSPAPMQSAQVADPEKSAQVD